MSSHVIAMLYGIIGSVLFNISKGMQRQGIGAFRELLAARREKRRPRCDRGFSTLIAVYVIGIILNNSLSFFAVLANRYAPSSYFTSMFGIGIIALIPYSAHFLHEPIHPVQYFGAVVLALGTLVLGYDGILRQEFNMANIDITAVWVFIAITLVITAILMRYAWHTRDPFIMGVVFGLFTGFSASLDPVLKGIGQNFGGGEGFLPIHPTGWIMFLVSFIFSTVSFLACQWIFARGIRASVLIPSQNCTYIVYPLFIQVVALPGFTLDKTTALGLLVTMLGIIMMQTMIIPEEQAS